MVGPELTSGTLEAIAALTGTDFAPPLGSHPAVGKLVAIRYGAALADPQVAAMVARGKTAAAHCRQQRRRIISQPCRDATGDRRQRRGTAHRSRRGAARR